MSEVLGYYWAGPSELDGAPTVCIFTGFGRASANVKTGPMIQTWILRADIDPLRASSTGEDRSVCGDCPHRWALGGQCYVTLHRAPLQAWRTWRAGRYQEIDRQAIVGGALAGRKLRLGAYGDPAAVPYRIWADCVAFGRLAGWTGYTHQWRRARHLRHVVMASVDSAIEQVEAQSAGWRTFRVAGRGDARRLDREMACPASAEAGHRLACDACMACDGAGWARPATAGSVVIQQH